MNPRQFFTTQHYWGKLLGGIFGFLIGHSVGAVFGVLIGNFFDRGLAGHFSRSHWHYHQEKRKHVQQVFFASTFAVMGHIAKADGRVSEQEIAIAKQIMQELGLTTKQKQLAQQAFNSGKQRTFNLHDTLKQLLKACHDNPDLIKLFVDLQYQAATIDPLTAPKIQVLNTLLRELGFAPLQAQYRFYEDFAENMFRQSSQYSSNNKKRQDHSQYQQNNRSHSSSNQQYHTAGNTLAHAYAILEISQAATKQEVKKAYRRHISRNHPDKLIAQGLPEEMIKIANHKTQQITKAYDQICASKGW